MDRAERRTRAEQMRGPEYRTLGGAAFELRNTGDGTRNLTGYASVTETPYDMGWYTETIRRGAFRETLARNPDVQLLINHAGEPLARTTVRTGPGSLRLNEDDRGLHVDATLNPDDPDVARLAMKSGSGLMDQMSFAFSGARSEWDDEFENRTIVSLDIHRGDVSVVNQGANPSTSFAVRETVRSLAWYRARATALRARGNGHRELEWLKTRNTIRRQRGSI